MNPLIIQKPPFEDKRFPAGTSIVHVVATLDTGGIEKWLLEIIRRGSNRDLHRKQYHLVSLFACDGTLSQEFKDEGASVFSARFSWWSSLGTIARLTRYFRSTRCGVVHCHLDYLAGVVLPAAWIAGCRCRIVHVHSTKFPLASSRSLLKRISAWILRRSCGMFSSHIIGCSEAALQAFHVSSEDPKRQVIHCSISFAGVARALSKFRPKLREQFGWKSDEKFILHVGRHANAKNIRFALDIFRQIVNLDTSVRFILAGSGELTEQLKEQAIQLGISDKVAFLGNRSDVFDLMVAADLMLFPSLYEGLPVTIVEAQACALRILMSNKVTNEVCVVPDLIQTLSLDEEVETWAKRAIQMLKLPTTDNLLCQHAVSRTDFNVDITVDLLDKLYQS